MGAHLLKAGRSRSLALKSTPELDALLASDKDITIVFHSATSAELFADGSLIRT